MSRTLPPTRRHLQRARRRGVVPQSTMLTGAAVLLACAVVGWSALELVGSAFANASAHAYAEGVALSEGGVPTDIVWELLGVALFTIVLLALTAFGAALVVGVLQTRFNLAAPRSRWSGRSPLSSMIAPERLGRRLVGGVSALLVAAIAIAALAWVAPTLGHATGVSGPRGWLLLRLAVGSAVGVVIAFFGLLALGDLVWSRWLYQRSVRMTQEEARRDAKSAQADPQVRKKMRQEARRSARQAPSARSRSLLLADRKRPLAVLLTYTPHQQVAPIVASVLSGSDASQRLERAGESALSVLEDSPLTRQLASLGEGASVPPQLHEVVAEAMAQAVGEG